jgi:hypothetical protein
MERARVFRTTGPIRILLGLTLPEILAMLASSMIALHVVDQVFYIEFLVFLCSLLGSFMVIRFIKLLLRPAAAKHFFNWISEDDSYTPLSDADHKPLVWMVGE